MSTEAQALLDAQTQEYLTGWAKELGVDPYSATDMAAALLRQQMARTDVGPEGRNFDTAISILFGSVSWVDHKEWLRRCVTAFAAFANDNPVDWTSEEIPGWLYAWAAYYDAEVEKAP